MGKIRIQGHEKFPLREGWLTKGLEQLDEKEYSKIFNSDDAPDIFGLGSNMVKALRYWMKAFGLIEDIPSKGVKLSKFGTTIKKYDLYIEDDFTLWLLHSYIAKNITDATTWFMFFNRCDLSEFNKQNLFNVLKREIDIYSDYTKYSEKSLQADIDVLLSMYSRDKKLSDPEDKNISPFVSLELLKHSQEVYFKNKSKNKEIGEWIALYEIAQRLADRDSVSIEEISHDECGLTKIFNMSDMDINGYLDRLNDKGRVRVDRTAGLDMVYKISEDLINNVVNEYYDMYR